MTAPQATDSALNTLEVVLFHAGGYFCAVVASQVGAMSLASEDCDATPVEEIFGLQPVTTELERNKLELKPARAEDGSRPDPIEVLVTPPVDLLRLAVTDIYPLPQLVAAHKSLRWLRALAILREQEQSSLVLLFDVPADPAIK